MIYNYPHDLANQTALPPCSVQPLAKHRHTGKAMSFPEKKKNDINNKNGSAVNCYGKFT